MEGDRIERTPELIPEATKRRQDWLIPFENPLTERKGLPFFRSIPRTPGVYLMLGPEGEVLYVGKAKSLRHRVNSYRLAKPGRDSSKVIRLVHLIQDIRYECCRSETAALLRENELLRGLNPPFNVLNTSPESYYFIAVKKLRAESECSIQLRLTCNDDPEDDETLFGAFKGRGTVRLSFLALLRLVWAFQNTEPRFMFPARLAGRKVPYVYTTAFPEELVSALRDFLRGRNPRLLALLTEKLLANEQIPRWVYHVIQDDLELLRDFYKRCTRRNFRLRKNHGVKSPIIPQDALDDLLVLEQQRLGKIE